MMIWMLVGLVADVIFDSAASRSRAYEAEIDRYFAQRGLKTAKPRAVPAQ